MEEKLLNAVQENDVKALEIILKSIHEPDKLDDLINFQAEPDDKSLLLIATESGFDEIIDHLIKVGANVNQVCKFGTTPLYAAASNGFEKAVELLLQVNAEVNMANINGVTPLFSAAYYGHDRIVKLLLQANADVNQADINGATPLFVAAQNNHEKIIELLLQANASVNQAKINAVTPLFIAAYNGHDRVVKLLLQANAEVDQANINGVTPLFVTTHEGHEKVVELLLQANANVNQTTIDGTTPLSIALERQRPKCVELLLGAGAGLFATIATAQLPSEVDTTNKVVIGMTNEQGIAITRKLPGWEQAITSVVELNEAIQNDIALNDLALLQVCHHLLAKKPPASATIEIIKAKLYNTRGLFNLCLYKFQQPSMRSLFFNYIRLYPEELKEKFTKVETVFNSPKFN